jgi:hypothetical protein
MAEKQEIFTMKSVELKRLEIIQKVLRQEIKQVEAAKVLRLSTRQVGRIVRRVQAVGEIGIIHSLRGRSSKRKIADKVWQKVIGLYHRIYEGFGPTLLSEKLAERDGIKISDETLRKWMAAEGLWRAKRQKVKKFYQWRERKDCYGQMVQMDGSHHDWLEGRGPWMVLMGYIDDATNCAYGKFYEYEGTVPAMASLKAYVLKHGIPTSIYLDKHSTYKINKAERYRNWPFKDAKELSQFERACRQLGVELIHAHSPQAKGRVERLFGTLQDRLVKELRLEKASSLPEANKVLRCYLPKFNKRFGRVPKSNGDLHRVLNKDIKLDEILAVHNPRVMRNDHTISYENRWYQITTKTKAREVMVQERLNGRMYLFGNGRQLDYKEIPGPAQHVYQPRERLSTRRIIQAPQHPWRQSYKDNGIRSNN